VIGDVLALEQFLEQRDVVPAELAGDGGGHAEVSQAGGDVDRLAADIHLHPQGAIDCARLQTGDLNGVVERRIEGDGDDLGGWGKWI